MKIAIVAAGEEIMIIIISRIVHKTASYLKTIKKTILLMRKERRKRKQSKRKAQQSFEFFRTSEPKYMTRFHLNAVNFVK